MVVTLIVAAAASAAATGFQPHYDEAKRCYFVARFVGAVELGGRATGGGNTELGTRVAEDYRPVLVYEGYKRGLSREAILSDIDANSKEFVESTVAQMNKMTDAKCVSFFNSLISEMNECGRMPSFIKKAGSQK